MLVALTLVSVAAFAWRRRSTPGAKPLAFLTLAVAWWSFSWALDVASADLASKILWSKLEYVGAVYTAALWLMLAIEHTGHGMRLTRPRLVLLMLPPTITLALVWTNELHGLIWRTTGLQTWNQLVLWEATYGPMYWFFVFYSFVYLAVGTVLLLVASLRASHLQRRQTATLLIAVIAPWLWAVLYIAGFDAVVVQTLQVLLFAVSALAISWSVFRFRLLDITPIARNMVIESMSDAVVVLDAQNRIVDLNPAACRLCDVTVDEVIGEPAMAALPISPEDAARYGAMTEVHAEIAREAGGEQHYFDLHVTPLHQNGRLVGRLVMLHDITMRRQVEAALRQRNAELQEHNEELDAFSHTVAHDLKSPLSNIIGFADVLLKGFAISPEEMTDSVRIISQSAHKMNNIIDELLLLASVRKAEVKLTPLDTKQLVDEALTRLKPLVEERGAEVVAPGDWPVALGYGPWVEEVWANYISNAVKYGGDPPRVELGATAQPDGMVRFWVRDNGRGLTPEEHARLFTPFTRLDTVRAKGHGLGLSVVQRIVEKLGGQVGVESEPGRGSVFSFLLPGVADGEAAEAEAAAHPSA